MKQYRANLVAMIIGLLAIFTILWRTIPDTNSTNHSLKVGVWITYLNQTEKGNVDRIVAKAKKARLAYICVKTHDVAKKFHGQRDYEARWYTNCPPKLLASLVEKAHAAGIKIYAWGYVYPNHIEPQIEMIEKSLDVADGYIFNAETQFCKPAAYDSVVQLCEPVRQYRDTHYPNKLLAYSTFGRTDVGLGAGFPYVLFGQYCDAVWPQSYHKTFRWKPDYTIQEIDRQFDQKYDDWKNSGQASAIKPVVHTVQAYRKGAGVTPVPASELKIAIQTSITDGHNEINLWEWHLMEQEHWDVIAQFTGGDHFSVLGSSRSTHPSFLEACFTWLCWIWYFVAAGALLHWWLNDEYASYSSWKVFVSMHAILFVGFFWFFSWLWIVGAVFTLWWGWISADNNSWGDTAIGACIMFFFWWYYLWKIREELGEQCLGRKITIRHHMVH